MDDTGKLFRLIDANLNRAREGLRVVEDAFRFLLDDAEAQSKMKGMRHSLRAYEELVDPDGQKLLANRASEDDVGAFINPHTEMARESWTSVFKANLRRVQEALRCLEEYGKLIDPGAAEIAKRMRFETYDFERDHGLESPDNSECGEEL